MLVSICILLAVQSTFGADLEQQKNLLTRLRMENQHLLQDHKDIVQLMRFNTLHPLPYCRSIDMYCEKETNHRTLIPCEETLYMNEQLEICRDAFLQCTTSWSQLQEFKPVTTAHNFLRLWKESNNVTLGPDIPSPDKPPAPKPPPHLLRASLPHKPKIPKAPAPDLPKEELSGASISPDINIDRASLPKTRSTTTTVEKESGGSTSSDTSLNDADADADASLPVQNSPEAILKRAQSKDQLERLKKLGLK
jgi:hypothetical protein